tara:strand:- start:1844 stop:2260 length:417 start_codon:yes stop_codon:yes gene_type:complete
LGAPLIGLASSAFITLVSNTFRIKSESLSEFQNLITQISGIEILYAVLIIGVVMPIIEELVFRGLLWKLLKFCRFSDLFVFYATSILFAAAHIDPIHVLGVFPLAIFFGWLRLKTNSVIPGIFAHMSNNLLACALILL